MDELTFNNDYLMLLTEAQKLQEELSAKIIEHDQLVLIECKNLKVAYFTSIGIYEYKVFEQYCQIQRIKRKIELIQIYLNRDEAVIMPVVEEQLDREYAAYTQRLEDYLHDINTADTLSKCELLSEEENDELKKLYRGIVKRLHPDVNPNVTEQQLILFHKAVDAYECGDLNALRRINLLIDNIGEIDLSANSLEQLKNRVARIRGQLERLRDEIREIKRSFPYNKKELLEDEKRVAQAIEELRATLESYKEIYAAYQQRLKQLLGDENG